MPRTCHANPTPTYPFPDILTFLCQYHGIHFDRVHLSLSPFQSLCPLVYYLTRAQRHHSHIKIPVGRRSGGSRRAGVGCRGHVQAVDARQDPAHRPVSSADQHLVRCWCWCWCWFHRSIDLGIGRGGMLLSRPKTNKRWNTKQI